MEWKDQIWEYPNRYRLQQNANGSVELLPEKGQSIQEGTPVNAENLNGMVQALDDHKAEIATQDTLGHMTLSDVVDRNEFKSHLEDFIELENKTIPKTTIPSDTIQCSADKTRSTSSNEYVKLKEIEIKVSGSIRVSFDYKNDEVSSTGSLAAIYKNDTRLGLLREKKDTEYTTYTQDFTNIKEGDLIQLYVHGRGYGGASVRNFRVSYTPITSSSPEVLLD